MARKKCLAFSPVLVFPLTSLIFGCVLIAVTDGQRYYGPPMVMQSGMMLPPPPQYGPPPPFVVYQGPGPRHMTAAASTQARHFRLPTMGRVTETLGALNAIGRYLLRKANPSQSDSKEKYSVVETASTQQSSGSSEESNEDDLTPASSNQNHSKISAPQLVVDPSKDEELGNALYTLGRNVLGKNVTDSLVPVVQTVNSIGKFLPPLIYRDGRIILGSASNATKDGGSIKDVVCTTPSGNSGKCLDLSGCPSLLFDLANLRKSLCFKALFVPGVCCPDKREIATQKPPPLEIITTPRPITSRPEFQTSSSTRRPVFEEPGIPTHHCGVVTEGRVVGGNDSEAGQWPWMAAIFLHGQRGKTEFWCGGSLISRRYILTAAHCTKDQRQKSFSPRQFTVRLGDYDLQRTDDAAPETYNVVEIIAHKDFIAKGFYNDVALLKLDRDVNYNRFITPICLPSGRSRVNNFVGSSPTIIGWGTNRYGGKEQSILQQVKLPVWSNQDCDRAYLQPITDIFLCAGIPQGGKDACQGDSGGPLMLEMESRWVQIGIVSFGNKCAEPGYPGVYTRITRFLDWIYSNAI